MKEYIRIKSFSKGLTIKMEPDAPFEDLLRETAQKFRDGKSFFGRAAVGIMFKGRELSPQEESCILDVIEENCNLRIVCVVTQEEDGQELVFDRALQFLDSLKAKAENPEREIQVIRGSLRDGEELETPNHVILLGDLEDGCSIVSEGSILVLGSLCGRVQAGKGAADGRNIVAALEMTPEELFIGDFKYIPEKKARWGKKKRSASQIAVVQNDTVLMEEFTKERLRDF